MTKERKIKYEIRLNRSTIYLFSSKKKMEVFLKKQEEKKFEIEHGVSLDVLRDLDVSNVNDWYTQKLLVKKFKTSPHIVKHLTEKLDFHKLKQFKIYKYDKILFKEFKDSRL